MGEISMEIDSINDIRLPEPDEVISISPKDVEHSVQEVPVTGLPEELYEFEFPRLFTSQTLIELSTASWSPHKRANQSVQPYLRGCKWSPDGTCCLSIVNNDGVHVTELSTQLYVGEVTEDRIIDVMDSVIHIKEAGLIYDFCWFPGMTSINPETCWWLTTKQNAPIQMWDAYNGLLRCTYRGFDNLDEMEPAISLAFSQDATKIIGGYKKCIRTFDVGRPGREYAEQKIHSPASCLATSSNLLAVGSWNKSISLYSINETGHYKSIGKMHAHSGGVTQVKFTPDGLHLVSGARKDHKLLVWDIRNFRRPSNILSRVVETNQRVYFDISPSGAYLVSGGTDGVLKVWEEPWKSYMDPSDDQEDNASYRFPVHRDCCNSVSIHPLRPILATGSGQFHLIDSLLSPSKKGNKEKTVEGTTNGNMKKKLEFATPMATEQMDSEITIDNNTTVDIKEKNKSDESGNESKQSAISKDIKYSETSENSLVFWWIGKVIKSK